MQRKKALNKGLEALLGDAPKSNAKKTQQKKSKPNTTSSDQIQISKIKTNQYQPRSIFDEQKINELATSIKKHGVIQPILVRKEGEGFELIAGERRFRASKIAGLKKIPAVVTIASNTKSLEIAILENVQREDLNSIEVARGYQRLKDEFKYTQEQLSESIGKPRSSIANSLRLLSLSTKIQELISSDKISEGHAKILLGLEANLADTMAKKVVEEKMSVRDLEAALKTKDFKTATKKPKTRDEINLESALSSKLGSKVTINDSKGKGKLIIKYFSYDELDGIIEKISL
tara:strand:+ start:23498 stop:24364 length:867 start_codon:yes stop_codon:yes gene_type:complete